jgi:DNA-binding HxlR family transcriptional regulator
MGSAEVYERGGRGCDQQHPALCHPEEKGKGQRAKYTHSHAGSQPVSATATAWAWAVVPRVKTASAALVLLHLAEAVSDNFTYSDGQDRIVGRTGMSARTVQESLRALADDGLIDRDKQSAPTGRIPDAITLKINLSAIFAGAYQQDLPERYPLSAKSADGVPAEFADSDPGNGLETKQPAKSADLARAGPLLPRDSSLRKGEESLEPESRDSRATQHRGEPTARMIEISNALWDMTPETAQARAGGPRRISWALRDAVAEGGDLETIFAGMTAYLQDPDVLKQDGRYCAAPNRAIESGKWKTYRRGPSRPATGPNGRAVAVARIGVSFESPEGCTLDEMGAPADPGPARQIMWLNDWDFSKIQWRDWERGPPPGQPGCRIWPSVARWHEQQKGAVQDEF